MGKLDATKWVDDYGDMLLRFATPRVNDREIAKDLVQETFLAAWRNYDNFKGDISEKNWLFTILKNKIIDHYRKASTRLTDSLPEGGVADPFFDDDGSWTKQTAPGNWSINQSNALEKKEFYGVLDSCRTKLKPVQSSVFTMKYLDGLDTEEICKALNITTANYWVIMHRAKLQLRSCIEKNWFLK